MTLESQIPLAKFFCKKLLPYYSKYIEEEDLYQYCLIGLWRGLSTYNPKYNWSSYAFRAILSVLQNVKNGAKRKRQIPQDVLVSLDLTYDDGDPIFTPACNDNIGYNIDSMVIRSAISELKRSFRRTIIMYYICNMSLQEIADVEGVSKERIRQRRLTALQKLKPKLIKGGFANANQ